MAKRKRFQRGSLSRKKGMWTFRYSAKRASDGRLTERSKVICPATFSKSHAERLVNESGLIEQINSPALQTQTTFSELANHYLANVIQDRAESTQGLHKQLIKTYLLPRWGREVAVEIE